MRRSAVFSNVAQQQTGGAPQEETPAMRSAFEELGGAMRGFWHEDAGQNLIEHSLLIAFVALACATLFLGTSGSIKGIWTTSNSQLAAANISAS